MSRSPRMLLALLALSVPASALSLPPTKGTLSTETEDGRVFDVGTLPVGVPTVVFVTLAADQADVTLQSVSVLDVSSAKAFYTLDEWRSRMGALPPDIENADLVLGPKKVVVEDGTKGFAWPLVYFSPGEAWSQAEIAFHHDGRLGTTTQKIRAHAALPEFAVYPSTVDFGDVPVGGLATGSVTLRNDGSVPLVVSIGDAPDAVSSLEPEEVVVEPGESFAYALAYHPLNDGPFHDTMTLVSGAYDGASTLAVVELRANDCEHGSAAYDRDADGFTACAGDCDDDHASAHPGAPEILDGLDNDCDARVDDETPGYDDDGDGWCDHATSCLDPAVLPADCDDGNALVHPDAGPLHGVDGNCDGRIDDGGPDADHDGYAPDGGDCDDADDAVRPGRAELANGLDDDCDTIVDEGTVNVDDDGDGFAELAGDCHDGDAATAPGAVELANGRDDDCDGAVDEGSTNADDDGDGFAENVGDCDDAAPAVHPGAREAADGRDDDCDGRVDEGLDDLDRDGVTVAQGDCDDTDGWSRPGAEEVFDGLDNDCDGHVDDGVTPPTSVVETAGCHGGGAQGCSTGGLAPRAPLLLLALVALGWRRRGPVAGAARRDG